MAIEDLIKSKEFDQSIPTEIEQKFIPLFPERLSLYREQARPERVPDKAPKRHLFCEGRREFDDKCRNT